MFVTLAYKYNLKSNYKESMLFWKIQNVRIKKEHKVRILKNIKQGIFVPKLFLYLMPLTTVLYVYNIYKDFNMKLPSFIPKQYHMKFLNGLINFAVIQYLCCNTPFILSFDIIAIYTCVYLEAEFELLGYELKRIVNEKLDGKREELIECINYHVFLLKYLRTTLKLRLN